MPWQEELYPPNWKELARACKERADWKCEECGVEHGTIRIGRKKKRPYKVRLSATHPDNDPENPNPRLIALCELHHLRCDITIHVEHCKKTKQQKYYASQIDAGQMELF